LISKNGRRNLVVECDADGCLRKFFPRLPTELKAVLRGVGGMDADVDPDFVMTEARARKQARNAGWNVFHFARAGKDETGDLCSSHATCEAPVLKTRDLGR